MKENYGFRMVDFRADRMQIVMNPSYKPTEEKLNLAVQVSQRMRFSGKPEEPLFCNIAINIFEGAEANNYPFTINLEMTGVFFIDAEGEVRRTLMEEDAFNMLIPYARAMVGQLATLANLPTPIILPPMDVSMLQKGAEQE